MLGLQKLIAEGPNPTDHPYQHRSPSCCQKVSGLRILVSHPVDKVSLPKSFPLSRDLQKLGDAEVRGTVPLLPGR